MGFLHDYLADRSNPWAISIDHLVKCVETFTSTGDASNLGGEAHCQDLRFSFSYIWSPEVSRPANLPKKHPNKIPINLLEFVVALIQLAATITRLKAPVPSALEGTFPNDYPAIPILLCRTDNMSTKCWAKKVSSSSSAAQGLLLALLPSLLRRTSCGFTSEWLAGSLNGTADLLLRPDLTISSTAFCAQIYQKVPELNSWNFFHPAPECTLLLEHLLCSSAWQGDLSLPSSFGQFSAAGSTTSCFAMR
jgi:hypothetical protein